MSNNKAQLIYNSIFEYIAEGNNIKDITMSKIASIANIGKSTIYEYFSSKEEMITKTLNHYLEKEKTSIINIINDNNKFEMIIENIILNGIDNYKQLSLIGMMFDSYRDINDLYEFKKKIKDSIDEILTLLIDKGLSEGIINKNNQDKYNRQVILTSLNGFKQYSCCYKEDIKSVTKYTIDMMIRALK